MYAIILTGGKQVKVEVGQKVYIEKLDANQGDEVCFDKVLLIGGETNKVGAPFVEGATVKGVGKAKKVVVFKYKAKANYRRKTGHRQPYTCVDIQAINA